MTVSDRGEREGGFGVALASTMALAMLLYIAVLINGQGMATAIVEEKSSRLIEVILGAVTATEFMAGKILGVVGSGTDPAVDLDARRDRRCWRRRHLRSRSGPRCPASICRSI